MSNDSVVSIAWDVLKWAVVPIKRQFGYVISSKSYARDLQKEVGKLAYEAERIQNAVEEARKNLRNVYSPITEWQASAEKALNEARNLSDDFEKASKNCCYGCLPDPNCRYQFSTKAKDKIEDIKQLTQDCSQFKDISFNGPAPGNVAALTPARREDKDFVQLATATNFASSASTSIKLKDDGIIKSRESIMQEIMATLADNNNRVVGIYGMGGLGKSTLLVEAERRIKKEKLFDWVGKADVSENQDIKRIQGEIAHSLGLDIKDVEYVNSRAERLSTRLEKEEREKKKVLIILDNLWKGLDLKLVGIPCGHDNKVIGCKLLLTSRFQDVLRREMGCDKDFRLEELKDEEARRLFERMVGEKKVHDDPFKSLVDEALRKCAGLPFLIIAMGNIFKDADFYEWKDVLRQIEKSTDEGLSEIINKMLQLSYDRFKGKDGKEVKSLLRLCAVYGVSKPSLENLVRYGVGSRLFREDSNMEEVRNRLHSLIRTLKASSFLLVDDEDVSTKKKKKDNEDVDGFKIHDLVRGFVASVASRDDPFLVLNDKSVIELPKDKLKSYTAACFPFVDMKELPKELDCPEMQILLLFTNNKSLKVPDTCFNSMRKLMVLHLSQVRLTCSPSPFQLLENLRTLCLDGCSLEDVAMIGELKGLYILSFVNSKIQRLPKEIGQLVELRLLDLNHCSQLEIIEPGVLGSLMKLEELYMENSFDQWNPVEQTPSTNAKLIELNNMKNLCTLHVSILDPSVLPEDLNVKKLTKYKIHIGDVTLQQSHKGSSTLELKLDPTSDILRKGCIQTLLGKTDDLFLDGSNGIEQSICTLSQEGFPKLKHLHAKNSPSIHYVLDSPSHTDFKTLESLILENLINLEQICNNHISFNSFIALKEIRVESCDKMEILFPLSLLKELPQLEEIRAIKCHLMREIVQVDDCGKVELPNLHALELRNLPNIKNFFTQGMAPSSSTSKDEVGNQVTFFNGQQVSIPFLESLTMAGLPNLENLWTDESPLGLSNLQLLRVSSCKSLSKVINSRSLTKLHKLHTLKVEACNSVQEIFDLDGLGADANIETLSELNTIYIYGLVSLRCIWNKNPCGIVKFHNLKKLYVYTCHNLRFLFFPSMVQSLAQLRELYIWNCKNMEAIIMEEEGLRVETSETLVFMMLTDLHLADLESLTCFSRKKCTPKAQDEDRIKSCYTVLFNQEVAFPSLETVYINSMNNIEIIWDNQVATDSFHKLKSLQVRRCHKLLNIVLSCILGWLKSLESLEVRYCGSLEVVFKLQPVNHLDGHHVAHLPLKKLKLDELPKLKCVWDKELHSQVKFQCLHFVTVSGCESLASLFPASIAIQLTQLEKLEICTCGIVELIEEEGLVPKVVFPRLTSLKLEHLTELKCIHTRIQALHWPALKMLEVYGCNKVEILAAQPENEMPLHKQPLFLIEKGAFPNLQELKLDLSERMEVWHVHFHVGEVFCKLRVLELHHFSKESAVSTCLFVWSLTSLEKLVVCKSYLEDLSIITEAIEGLSHEQKVTLPFPRFFQHIKTLDVSCCDGLSSMFTPTIFGNLVELTKLRISNCKMLTEVIYGEGGEEGLVAFNQLKHMELNGLIELRCFSSIKYTLKFPLLEDVIVKGCPHMKFFSEGPIEAPKLEGVQVSTEAWFWKGNLNITIQDMFEEMATIAGVKSLRLSEFPELIGKWDSELNPIKLSWQLNSLMVDKCPSFINVIPSRLMFLLHNLEDLQVCDCESLEEIFDLKGLLGVGSTRLLPSLWSLDLVNLPKLRRLWHNNLQGTLRFNVIYRLTLYNCNNLKHAFTSLMARCLANLCKIEIKECGQMEGVIVEEEGQGSTVEKITFPRLWFMKLECLPNLTSFLSGRKHPLECPSLQSLTIAYCSKMKSLTWQSLMEIDHYTPSLFTPQELRVTHCDKLNILSFVASMNKWAQRDDQHDLLDHEAGFLLERGIPTLERLLLFDKDIQMI
ncbi:uncharacterized protein LOC108957752 isoform X2 [Eucalyptus grandis]|uniref:uncharacterized protein LOC108957752 isoform X2 n=1 Tax=Eucalyptus grandis TaxID=71139 RepID=UPI00192E84EB|nr:uncharacterized protein LOC108957752 isoform X2 [Eucalyptus grandis]